MAEVLAVRLTPRGGRDAVEGWATDADGRPYLKVRVASPPVDGAANAALLALLAKTLKIPRSAVRLAAGDIARLWSWTASPGMIWRKRLGRGRSTSTRGKSFLGP